MILSFHCWRVRQCDGKRKDERRTGQTKIRNRNDRMKEERYKYRKQGNVKKRRM